MYMNKVLAIITDRIPNSCAECVCSEGICSLPMKNYPRDEIKKEYSQKRHMDCPLKLNRGDNGSEEINC